MPYKLSPSTLGLFEECPLCFYLQVKKKIKRPAGPFPSLPSGVDRVLKEHFDRHRLKGEVPREIGLTDVKLFPDMNKMNIWRNNRKGILYTDKAGNVLSGAVDELLQKGNKLIVLDFKTRGFPLKEDTPEMYQSKLDLYNLLFRKNGYSTEDYSYLLFYHPKELRAKGELILNVDLVKLSVNVEAAEKLWKDALKVLERGKEPKASKECTFCNWERLKND